MIAWLRSLWAIASDYEGPAKVEVFGRDEHIGWVRSNSERIDILTVEGEAIQIDARARFRITPMTWQELTYECLKHKSDRAYVAQKHQAQLRNKDDELEYTRVRASNLRLALKKARDDIGTNPVFTPVRDDLVKALEVDDNLDKYDGIPF